MSSRLSVQRTRLAAGALFVVCGLAVAPTSTAAPRGIDPTVPVLKAVGGFRATLSWGDTEDGEPVTLHLEIGKAGVFPPDGHQMVEDLVVCDGGQPTARVNSFVYLRDRFQLPVVDVFVDWQEYCVGDPYDGDNVEYTLVIAQLPEYSANGEATVLKRITGTYRPAYRGGYGLGLEDHVARVEVAAAPAGSGNGGGPDTTTTLGIIALVAVGAGGAVSIIRRVRRGPATEIDGIRRQIEALRHHRQQLELELHDVQGEIAELEAAIAEATRVLLAAQEQLRAAQGHAGSTDTYWNYMGLVPALILGTGLSAWGPGRTQRWQKFWAIVGGAVITVCSSWVSWASATVPPQVTAAFAAAQQQVADARVRHSRQVGREQELGNQIVTVDRQIAELEARQQSMMANYPGAQPAR